MAFCNSLKRPKLNVPYYPAEEESRAFFENTTQEEKIIQEYTGIDFLRIEEISVFDYWRYLHDAVVWNCNQTEKGKQYLENAYNYTQTKADRQGLSKLIGGSQVVR